MACLEEREREEEGALMRLFEAPRREARYLSGIMRALRHYREVKHDPDGTLVDDIEKSVTAFPDNPAFIFEGEVVTYRAFDERANRIARWALEEGLKPGETVALFMLNRPDYVAVWYGLAKAGVVTALVNNQLAGHGLAHCINIAGAARIIVDAEIADEFATAQPHIEGGAAVWMLGGAAAYGNDLDEVLAPLSPDAPDPSLRDGIGGLDTALKMYTSGTTGLPKAAAITHLRARSFMGVFTTIVKARPEDRTMLVLPLYHATGGLCALGMGLTRGGALILEKKFSASRFWDVAAEQHATLFMYVGELCRFLLAAPQHPRERDHSLRCAVGNGLRPDVWDRFKERFNIPWILEFYGSTEGNVSLVNLNDKAGAVGRIPSYLAHRFNVRIVKFDVETEEPVRGPDGLCSLTDDGEVGETVGEIREDDPRYRFKGYAGDQESTDAKIIRDVFKPGDAWFRTGDLMRRDALGFYYFVDRIGDTFRWRSENVATSEVAEAIGAFPGVRQANVYGVAVTGYDGRAGMAALSVGENFDLAALHEHLAEELPAYARPVFVRIEAGDSSANTTGTFKLRKMELVKDGFDPALTGDTLYFDDPRAGAFVALDAALHAAIEAGDVRL